MARMPNFIAKSRKKEIIVIIIFLIGISLGLIAKEIFTQAKKEPPSQKEVQIILPSPTPKALSLQEKLEVDRLIKSARTRSPDYNGFLLAEKDYISALEIDPTNEDTISGLVDVYAFLSEDNPNFNELFLSTAKRYAELEPDFPSSYATIGLAYTRNKQYDEAIMAYEKALELDEERLSSEEVSDTLLSLYISGKAFHLTLIGDAYKSKGDYVKAKEYYQRALKLKPGYLPAQRAILKLQLME